MRYPLVPVEDGVPDEDVLAGTNDPETEQAWTVSFVMRTLLGQDRKIAGQQPWQEDLTREVLGDPVELALRPAYLDRERAFELEEQLVALGPSEGA